MYLGARPETRLMYINSLADATLRSHTPNVAGFYPENITFSSRTSLYIPQDLFVIDSTNKTMEFTVGATTLNVSMTEGSYTGATLAAHIQAIFGNGFLITYSTTTKLFGIKNTAANFVLKCNLYIPSWNVIGFVSGALFNGTQNVQYYSQVARRHTGISLSYDIGPASDCGFFALLGERNKTNSLSENATVNLRLSNVDDYATATSIDITPTENGTFAFLDGIIAVPVFRYVWITIIDYENTSEYISFSQLYLGGFVHWDNRTVNHGFTLQYLDRSVRTESVSGALFFEKYNKYPYLSNLKLAYLTRTEVNLLQQAWFDLGKSEHFYLSLDSGWMNSDITEFMFFGVFDSDPVIEEVGPRYFNGSFTFRGD